MRVQKNADDLQQNFAGSTQRRRRFLRRRCRLLFLFETNAKSGANVKKFANKVLKFYQKIFRQKSKSLKAFERLEIRCEKGKGIKQRMQVDVQENFIKTQKNFKKYEIFSKIFLNF